MSSLGVISYTLLCILQMSDYCLIAWWPNYQGDRNAMFVCTLPTPKVTL